MKFMALQPFVPAGKDFDLSRQLFTELGFNVQWDAQGYTGFEKDGCRFILQNFDNREFAANFMVSVNVDDVAAFRRHVIEKQLPEKFGIRVSEVTEKPYGKEVNIIDIAGVCWHFVQ